MLKTDFRKYFFIVLTWAIMISPIFFYFSKNMLLFLVVLILGIPAIIFYQRYMFEEELNYELYQIDDNVNFNWIVKFTIEVSEQLNIKPPTVWISDEMDYAMIVGDNRESHMLLSTSVITRENEDTIKAIIMHELGHVVLHHNSICAAISFLYVSISLLSDMICRFLLLVAQLPLVWIVVIPLSLVFALFTLVIDLFLKAILIPSKIILRRFFEYAADDFSTDHDPRYAIALEEFFDRNMSYDPKGIWKFINFKDHPIFEKRARRVKERKGITAKYSSEIEIVAQGVVL